MAGFHISLLLFNILKQTGIEALKTDKAYILTKKKNQKTKTILIGNSQYLLQENAISLIILSYWKG